VVPARVPPLRDMPQSDPAVRLEMVRLAIAKMPGVFCDRRELDRPGPSYTIDTLRDLGVDYPGERLVLILGRDAFDHLPGWFQWQSLFKHADIAVVTRPGQDNHMRPDWLPAWVRTSSQMDPDDEAAQVVFVDVEPCDISATDIRERVHQGLSISGLVPQPVESFIKTRKLYV